MTGFFIFIGIVALFVLVGIPQSRKVRAKKDVVFNQLAADLGLNYVPEKSWLKYYPIIEGELFGFPVRIFETAVSDEDSTNYYMNIHIENSGYKYGFTIARERLFSKIGRKLGFKDIEFGNKKLDDFYKFESHFEEEFRTIITPKIQEELVNLIPIYRGTIEHVNGKMEFKTEMRLMDEGASNELKQLLGLMLLLLKSRS